MSYQWKKRPSATESVTAKQRAFPTRPKLGRPVSDLDAKGRPRRRRGLFEVADESLSELDEYAARVKTEPTLAARAEDRAEDNEVKDDLDDLNRLIAGRLDGDIDIDALDRSLQVDLELDELDIDVDDLADIAAGHDDSIAAENLFAVATGSPKHIDTSAAGDDESVRKGNSSNSTASTSSISATPSLSATPSSATPSAPVHTDDSDETADDPDPSDGPYTLKPRILGKRAGTGKKKRLFGRFKESSSPAPVNGSAIEIKAAGFNNSDMDAPAEAPAPAPHDPRRGFGARASLDARRQQVAKYDSGSSEPGLTERDSTAVSSTATTDTASAIAGVKDDSNARPSVTQASVHSASVHSMPERSPDPDVKPATTTNAARKSAKKLSAPAPSAAPAAQGDAESTSNKAETRREPLRKVVASTATSAPAQTSMPASPQTSAEAGTAKTARETSPTASQHESADQPVRQPRPASSRDQSISRRHVAADPSATAQKAKKAKTPSAPEQNKATTARTAGAAKPDLKLSPSPTPPSPTPASAAASSPSASAPHSEATVETADTKAPGRYTKALRRNAELERQRNKDSAAARQAGAVIEGAPDQAKPSERPQKKPRERDTTAKEAVEKDAIEKEASRRRTVQRQSATQTPENETTADTEVRFRNIQPASIDALPEPIRKSIPTQLQSESSVNKVLGADETSGTYTVFLPKLDTPKPKEEKPFGRDPLVMSLGIFSALFLVTATTGFLMSRDEGADRWIAQRVATVKEQANELATNIQSLKPNSAQPPEDAHESSIQPVSPQPSPQPASAPDSPQPVADSPQPQMAVQGSAPQPGSSGDFEGGNHELTGTLISSNGEPVAGEQIVLISPSLGARFTTTTRDDGEFVLENLMPGTDYALNVTPTGPYKTLQVLDLSVADVNDHLPLTLEAMPTANLSGRIVDANNNAVPNYQLWATGFDEPGQQVNFRSDHEGNYRLYGLPTGKVQFTSKSEPKVLITSVVLNGGADEIVDLVVDYGPHEIGGIATDSDGNPLSGVEITLEWSVKRDEIRSMGTRTSNSGPDGSFRFAELGPGKHFLTARAEGLPLIRRSIDVGTDETEIALELGAADSSRLN